jgi:signal transduction histidine kinase
MTHPTGSDLRDLDLFSELSDEQLEPWAAAAALAELPAGTMVAEQGERPRGVTLLLAGTIEALVSDGSVLAPVGDHVAPTWVGATTALTDTPSGVWMRASTDVRVATIGADDFVELAIEYRCVFRRVMAKVRPVMERLTTLEQNRERLTSLGTMAAGLAHELNNPAAAARRSSADLAEALEVLSSTIGMFVESGIGRDGAAKLVALQREALDGRSERSPLTALDAADAEDELADALTAAGVAEGWRIVEPLAAAGVDRSFVERVTALAGPATDATIKWIAASLSARELAGELAESTDRMSKLVMAIKTYAYMDRGGVVEVDLREGLETTLTILGHKLKHKRIQIVRDYDGELPRLTVHGAELNQVWTNLLDNAIDALGDHGTITITTRQDGSCAEVDIADDGPGIPSEIRDRVFDPFFTTKDVGRGSGLGLDTSRRILVERHRGSLTLDSAPGRTVFRARLPMTASQEHVAVEK